MNLFVLQLCRKLIKTHLRDLFLLKGRETRFFIFLAHTSSSTSYYTYRINRRVIELVAKNSKNICSPKTTNMYSQIFKFSGYTALCI